MVIVGFPSPVVSISITIINLFVELLMLKTFKNLNAVYECNLLACRRTVRMQSHKRRIKFLTVCTVILFLILEVNYSTFSFSTTTKNKIIEKCVSVVPSLETGFEKHQFSPEARTAVGSCLSVDGDEVSIRLGNFSLESKTMRVSCGEKVYFKFKLNDTRELSTANSEPFCMLTEFGDECVRVKFGDKEDENVMWMTPVFDKYDIDDEKREFTKTEIMFPFRNHWQFFAKRMLRNENFLSVFFRIDVLLDAVNETCVFEEDGATATVIPTGIFVVLIACWVVTLFAFTTTAFFLHGRRFYNIENAFDFARKTRRASDDEEYPIAESCIRKTDLSGELVMCSCNEK